ncbi:MAG: exopolyphosphatase [Saprospiraceae bacterium]
MNKNTAVIDLGTNTFTMLIANCDDNGKFQIIYHERHYVKLAEDGIALIGEHPYQRAMVTMIGFKTAIDKYGATAVKALGTAALRTASNGKMLVEDIFSHTQIAVNIIEGDEEADLIYEGVRYAYPMDTSNQLIMDIGGGSVEFIIANANEKIWAQSFPIGVAVLKKKFHHLDPIGSDEIRAIESYLNDTLQPLFEISKQYPCNTLIGASGTFDVLENIFLKEQLSPLASIVEVANSDLFYKIMAKSTSAERYAMENIPPERVEMIVVAMVLIQFVLKSFHIEKIGISKYAMKEGMMSLLAKGD